MKTRLNVLNLLIKYEMDLEGMRVLANAIDTDSSSYGYEQWQVASAEIKAMERIITDLINTLL